MHRNVLVVFGALLADDLAVLDSIRSVPAALGPAGEVFAVEQLNLLVGETRQGRDNQDEANQVLCERVCACVLAE